MKKHVIIIVFSVLVFYCEPAFAYIDPGSGSYFIQAILGIFFATLYSLRNFLKKIYSKILGSSSEK